jgi:hypothetical protein
MTTTTKLSPKRAELIERMRTLALNPNDTWQPVPGHGITIRYSERGLATPDWCRERKPIAGLPGELTRPYWDQATYNRHVFLTMVGVQGKPILRIARAPWVGAMDRDVTLAVALRILDDPASAL